MTGKVFSGKTNEKIKRKVFYIHQADKKKVSKFWEISKNSRKMKEEKENTTSKIDQYMSGIDVEKDFLNTDTGQKYEIGKL